MELHNLPNEIGFNFAVNAKYGIFATDCTNLRRFKTTKGGFLAKID